MEFRGGINTSPTTKETMVYPRTILAITQEGKEMAHQLLGKTPLGVVLSHLDEYSPQSVQDICDETQTHLHSIRRLIRQYPAYFQVKSG
jgi:hypothetical protein